MLFLLIDSFLQDGRLLLVVVVAVEDVELVDCRFCCGCWLLFSSSLSQLDFRGVVDGMLDVLGDFLAVVVAW